MSKGISLHIGVNKVDPGEYPMAPTHAGWEMVVVPQDGGGRARFPGNFDIGWEGPLASCEKDAEDMYQLAESQDFESTILKTHKATAERVEDEIRSAAKQLKTGDIFFLTYAGHGAQVEDISGDEKDSDSLDETWCLYDRMFLDDEQQALFAKFAKGVGIIVLSDSCHSGTATRSGASDEERNRKRCGIRAVTERTAKAIYEGNQDKYDRIQNNLERRAKPKASRILISACQDHEHAMGDDDNGMFTHALKKVWNDGKFKGNYEDLAKKIKAELKKDYNVAVKRAGGDKSKVEGQVPNFVCIKGASAAALAKFVKKRPFSI